MSIFRKILDWLPFDDGYKADHLPQPTAAGDIWREIDAAKVDFSAFTSYGGGYKVTLKRKADGFEYETTGQARTFDQALNEAWKRMPRT